MEYGKQIGEFFQALWQDFLSIAPQAAELKKKLEESGEHVINDHVAFRTFNIEPFNITTIEQLFFRIGYQRLESYQFINKHLKAWSYICPNDRGGTDYPLIFLSELLVEQLSQNSINIIHKLLDSVPKGGDTSFSDTSAVLFPTGRPWESPKYQDYLALSHESEYAAWLSVHGFRANHFTISVNHLKQLTSIESVLLWAEKEGFSINSSGGRVKGTPALCLEQGSTMADLIPVNFSDGSEESVPGGFYEFAFRFNKEDGKRFYGFVEGNADKIFESTDRNPE